MRVHDGNDAERGGEHAEPDGSARTPNQYAAVKRIAHIPPRSSSQDHDRKNVLRVSSRSGYFVLSEPRRTVMVASSTYF